jgi:hypothetical protein
MLDRAVRFYIRCFKEAGVTISPHVGKRKPRSASGTRKANGKTTGSGAGVAEVENDGQPKPPGDKPPALPPGMIEFPIPMGDKTGCIRVRADLTMEQYPLVEAMLNAVKVLAQTNSGPKS